MTDSDPQKAKREKAKKIYIDSRDHVLRADMIIEQALKDLKRLKDPSSDKEEQAEELRAEIIRDTEILIGLLEAGREGYQQRQSKAEFDYRHADGVIGPDGDLP